MLLGWILACTNAPQGEFPAAYPDIELESKTLDFGIAVPGSPQALNLKIRNVGNDTLHLGNPFFVGGEGNFSYTALQHTELVPDSATDLEVTFDPDVSEERSALLVILSDDPDTTAIQVPMVAYGQNLQLSFDPSNLDFGILLPGCPAERQLSLRNGGSEDVTVTDFVLDGSGFTLDLDEAHNGALPWTFAAGAEHRVNIAFDEDAEGASVASLRAMNGRAEMARTQVMGTRLTDAHTTETFELGGGSVDIVIPVQAAGTGSMSTNVTDLRNGFPDFLDRLDRLKVNYQIAVVQEADGCTYGNDPFFSSSMDRSQQLSILDAQLNGTSLAHGLVVASEAVKTSKSAPGGCNEGLVRDTARLAIMGYTFVGENHPDYGWQATIAPMLELKDDPDDVKIHGIIEDLFNGCGWGAHSYWSDAVNFTGGTWYSICDDVPTSLLKLADVMAEPETNFTLSYDPVEESIQVVLNGGVTTAWTFDRINRVLHLSKTPTSSGEVEISYDILNTCEQ